MSNTQVIVSQAIISGRIRNLISGQAVPQGLMVKLWYRPVPEGAASPADYKLSKLYLKLTADGYFCFSASGGSVFGGRSPAPDMQFRLDINAPGFQPLSHSFELGSEQLTSMRSTLELAGAEEEVTRVAGPFEDLDVQISPLPLRLAGQVLKDGDPDTPLAHASVTVSAPEPRPTVTTDERGFFIIDNLPLAGEVTVTLSDGNNDVNQTLVLDYQRPVNSHRFTFQ
ncbi:carboxypeptidase-like regulatory domain-containing protein [Marinobacter sp.]|uniref:carboxypeptidase-like regulatory domain-containing protein n=1 Tax=Marinobacter sp. TaxID=50741 RepID=UPI003A8DE170